MSDDHLKMHHDSYQNAVTGLAGSKDKAAYSFFRGRPDLEQGTLEAMYEQDPMAARIVDRLVDDATREGFKLKGADEAFDFSEIQSQLEDLDATNVLADAWRWARLYGGALVVMAVNDGFPMDQPLARRSLTKVNALHVVESPYVTPDQYNPGLGARAFRNPDHYQVTVPGSGTRRIHRSRVLRFDGVRVPPNRLLARGGWGPSVLDRVWEPLSRLGEAMGYAKNLLHRVSLLKMKITDLRTSLAGTEQSKKEVREVFESIKWAMDNLNMLVLDGKDDLTELATTLTGIDLLMQRFVEDVVRGTDYPRLIITGEQPGGINSNADSEIKSWYDFVSKQQGQTLTQPVSKIVDLLFQVRRNKGEEVPTEWTIDWLPLYQPTRKEEAEAMLIQAQADQIYMLNSVTTTEEVRERMVSDGLIEPLAPATSPEDPGLGT